MIIKMIIKYLKLSLCYYTLINDLGINNETMNGLENSLNQSGQPSQVVNQMPVPVQMPVPMQMPIPIPLTMPQNPIAVPPPIKNIENLKNQIFNDYNSGNHKITINPVIRLKKPSKPSKQKPEPSDTEPSDTEPSDTEPSNTEPSDTEPSNTELSKPKPKPKSSKSKSKTSDSKYQPSDFRSKQSKSKKLNPKSQPQKEKNKKDDNKNKMNDNKNKKNEESDFNDDDDDKVEIENDEEERQKPSNDYKKPKKRNVKEKGKEPRRNNKKSKNKPKNKPKKKENPRNGNLDDDSINGDNDEENSSITNLDDKDNDDSIDAVTQAPVMEHNRKVRKNKPSNDLILPKRGYNPNKQKVSKNRFPKNKKNKKSKKGKPKDNISIKADKENSAFIQSESSSNDSNDTEFGLIRSNSDERRRILPESIKVSISDKKKLKDNFLDIHKHPEDKILMELINDTSNERKRLLELDKFESYEDLDKIHFNEIKSADDAKESYLNIKIEKSKIKTEQLKRLRKKLKILHDMLEEKHNKVVEIIWNLKTKILEYNGEYENNKNSSVEAEETLKEIQSKKRLSENEIYNLTKKIQKEKETLSRHQDHVNLLRKQFSKTKSKKNEVKMDLGVAGEKVNEYERLLKYFSSDKASVEHKMKEIDKKLNEEEKTKSKYEIQVTGIEGDGHIPLYAKY